MLGTAARLIKLSLTETSKAEPAATFVTHRAQVHSAMPALFVGGRSATLSTLGFTAIIIAHSVNLLLVCFGPMVDVVAHLFTSKIKAPAKPRFDKATAGRTG